MNLYVKLGLISFLAGTLGASLPVILSFGLKNLTILDIFYLEILPGMFWGGLPSTILLTLRMLVWKKSGKPEKGMNLYCFVFGCMIGIITFPFVILSGGQ
jgi:hypothetical protein